MLRPIRNKLSWRKKADIAIPDAVGLVAASKFLSLQAPRSPFFRFLALNFQGKRVGLSILFNKSWLESDLKVIKGRELFLDLIKLANKKKWTAVLMGDGEQSAQKAVEKLKLNYKTVQLHAFSGPSLDKEGKPVSSAEQQLEKEIVKEINKIKPQLLFVGFGAPKQEKWTYRWLQKLNIGCAMVVGGTFNFISGKTKLPPKVVEQLNLEWLWRLLTGGKTLNGIFTATVTFPLKVFASKLTEEAVNK